MSISWQKHTALELKDTEGIILYSNMFSKYWTFLLSGKQCIISVLLRNRKRNNNIKSLFNVWKCFKAALRASLIAKLREETVFVTCRLNSEWAVTHISYSWFKCVSHSSRPFYFTKKTKPKQNPHQTKPPETLEKIVRKWEAFFPHQF